MHVKYLINSWGVIASASLSVITAIRLDLQSEMDVFSLIYIYI